MAKLLSVGIDIGTSTTQMILSELVIENTSSSFSVPSISITDKEVIYKSDIIFTPIGDDNLIQADKIQQFVSDQYKKAGITSEEIQTGAIIITGETVRKENSRAVADVLSGYAGDFVVATAGPDLESIIAGKGSGAYSYSEKNRCVTMNYDIGGGTTNLVVFDDGVTIDTACFDIGGRLIKVDKQNVIGYISPKYTDIINKEGIQLKVGQKIDLAELDKLFDIVVEVLENLAGIGEKNKYFDLLVTNKSLKTLQVPDYISFSGGVADFIDREKKDNLFQFGDVGILLGQRIKKSKIFNQFNVLESAETIRATVVGAGSHTTSVSGSTIMYKGDLFPLKNIPVVKISPEEASQANLSEVIDQKIQWFEVEEDAKTVAISFEGDKNPSYAYIQRLADSIVDGVGKLIQQDYPIIIIIKEDMAKALGHNLFSKLPKGYQFICIDSVIVNDGDYIDIGQPISNGQALPVVIKTLVFN